MAHCGRQETVRCARPSLGSGRLFSWLERPLLRISNEINEREVFVLIFNADQGNRRLKR